MTGTPWTVVVTPRSIDLERNGLDRELAQAGCFLRRVEGGPLSSQELAEAWEDADAAVLGLDAADANAMRAAPSLRVISRYGVGYDNVDVPAATAAGVFVTITADAPTNAVADLTIAFMLALVRDLPHFMRHPQAGVRRVAIRELSALTLGIVGLGRIGREVASRGRALGMRIVYFHPATRAADEGFERLELDALLRLADVVSLHVPLTDATRHMIGRAQLGMMKPTAFLINTARGGLIDEGALAAVLRHGALGGAALDVREIEPSPPGDPLPTAPNVILTPHIASKTEQSMDRMAREAIANLLAVKRGEVPSSVVNPAAGRVRRQ